MSKNKKVIVLIFYSIFLPDISAAIHRYERQKSKFAVIRKRDIRRHL